MKEKAMTQSGRDCIEIPLMLDDGPEVATKQIDGVLYHFKQIRKETLLNNCKVGDFPDYQPQTDADGYCYLLALLCE